MKPCFDLTKLLLSEMKFLNVIKDGNIMEWYSPFRQYKFEIQRSDNQLWYPEQYEFSKYLISLKIFDMLGVPITEIVFSEIDACRILDSMDAFIVSRWNFIDILNKFFTKEYSTLYTELFNVVAYANNSNDNFTKNIFS